VLITPYLQGQAFQPEVIDTMGKVLERICSELGLSLYDGKKNPAAEVVARKVIEFSERGVRDEDALYDATISDLELGDHHRRPARSSLHGR
jgi:hypothetical protein